MYCAAVQTSRCRSELLLSAWNPDWYPRKQPNTGSVYRLSVLCTEISGILFLGKAVKAGRKRTAGLWKSPSQAARHRAEAIWDRRSQRWGFKLFGGIVFSFFWFFSALRIFCYSSIFLLLPFAYPSVALDKSLSVCAALDYVQLCRHPADFSIPSRNFGEGSG